MPNASVRIVTMIDDSLKRVKRNTMPLVFAIIGYQLSFALLHNGDPPNKMFTSIGRSAEHQVNAGLHPLAIVVSHIPCGCSARRICLPNKPAARVRNLYHSVCG